MAHFNLRSSNTFGGGGGGIGTITRQVSAMDDPSHPAYGRLREERDLSLSQQKQRSRLLEQLLGGAGGPSQPGSPDSGGGLFGGFQGLLDSVMGDLDALGESRRGRINESYDTALNNQLAMFSDRGLLSSNLAGNAMTGVNRGRQSSLTELEDSLSTRRAGVKTQIGLAGLGQQQDMLMQLLSLLG